MESEILKLAEDAQRKLNAEDLISLYSENFLFEDTSSVNYITEKEKLREHFDRLFPLPEVKFTDVNFITCGGQGWGEWTWSGKSIKSGLDYSIRGASFFALSEGKIKRETIFYDPQLFNE